MFTRPSARNRRSPTRRIAARRMYWVLFWGVAFLSAYPSSPAYAYIDPGSGSLLLQMILAGLAGAAFYFREMIGGGLRKIFGRGRAGKVNDDSENGQGPEPES